MPRNPLAAAALLVGLAASPAFAQSLASQAAPGTDPARTLEQNQRAYVAPRPAAAQASALQAPAAQASAPAKERPVAAGLPHVTGRPVVLADQLR